MNSDIIISYAKKLYGGEIVYALENASGDYYKYRVNDNSVLEVNAGNARGVLYAVYDALHGKKSGSEIPEFSIRGLNPCESLNRHSKEQLVTLIDRMGRWRMNTLIVHSNYGFIQSRDIIEGECAKRGIDIIHYTYSNLSFMKNIETSHYAKNETGEPLYKSLQCETRLCVSDRTVLEKYAEGVKAYLKEHHDYKNMLFATADGRSLCACPSCRNKNAIEQWKPLFDIFFDIAFPQNYELEMISYVQRFSVPDDLSRIQKLARIMFDTHLRSPGASLGKYHECGKEGVPSEIRFDTRAAQPVNIYLLERLREWRKAFSGKLYVFENLMIQGIFGCPRPNTSVYLEDLWTFRKEGIDGVVYECFEPGIKPFLHTFDKIAATMWNINEFYLPNDFETAYLQNAASCSDGITFMPGAEKWRPFRGSYPVAELAELYCRFQLVPSPENSINILKYVLNGNRSDFDWLYISFRVFKKIYEAGILKPESDNEKAFLSMHKLWDFQELCTDPRSDTVAVIESLWNKCCNTFFAK